MNQQNSLKHESRNIQESNDIKRRRCDDDITVLKTSGSQINQESSSSSSSIINQKQWKTMENAIHINNNCPYIHRNLWNNMISNNETNNENINKNIGIYSSFYKVNNKIHWIENPSKVYKIDGYEATSIYFVDESMINKQVNKIPSSHATISMKKIDKKNSDINKQLTTNDNSKLLPSYCPYNCSSFSYKNLMEYARHFVMIHHYPIIYYDQLFRLFFDLKSDWLFNLSDNFMTRYIVKFMIEDNKYFLLELWTDNSKRYIQLYDFTYNELSSYQYDIRSTNGPLITESMIPIDRLQVSSNPTYREINSMDSIVLCITDLTRKVNYIDNSFIRRENCPLCHNNHIVPSCDYFFILNNMIRSVILNDKSDIKDVYDPLDYKIAKFQLYKRYNAIRLNFHYPN
ncbi:hypothetical protein HCN44_009980 [Aphidius gifuensis]|uniref:Uncharacterized protein n=1 Tax=Aphidius gifuensis TaxID=684658 RepID=A0A834Y2Z6_APHGI|nr:hypothetical protein HCN44_009980 [Aphidius gifuensis]